MTYELTEHGVKVSHTVINHDSVVMPYCVGGHPAFNCPVFENESFEDYIVEFEQPENAACAQLTEDGLINNADRVSVLENEAVIPVRHSLFYKDALVFDALKSRKVALKHKKTGHGILVSFLILIILGFGLVRMMDHLLLWNLGAELLHVVMRMMCLSINAGFDSYNLVNQKL